ncbi:MAG: DUF3240 family protein [Gammaproteobacteria bacterium]|nr:DUF3240 family protein [Gammaproteobacteria bacterium]
MNSPDCCLTLIVPKALEENLLDVLLEHETLSRSRHPASRDTGTSMYGAGGFTTSEVEGHGRNVTYQSSAEKVRGRAHRIEMKIIMQHADAQTLLQDIKQALPGSNIIYCITPVIESGSIV